MTLDPQSTIFMICFVYLMLHAGIWLSLLEHRSFQIDLWCGSGLLSGIGVVFLSLRGHVPEYMFLYFGQFFMLVGNWGRMAALRMYLAPEKQQTAYRVYALANTLYFVSIVYLVDVLKMDWVGLIWFNAFYTFLCFDYFRIGYKLSQRSASLGARLLMAAGLVFTVSLGLRALGVCLLGEMPSVYEASWHQGQMIVGQFLAITLSNVAFLRLYLEEVERQKAQLSLQLASTSENAETLRINSVELQRLLDEREEIIRQLAIFNKTAGMGALVASLAHELNQPLSAIQLNAELIESTLNDTATLQKEITVVHEAMRDLIEDNQRAASIIVTLRNMFGSGKKILSVFDMGQLVNDVLLLCRPKLRTQQITLTTQLALEPLLVLGDKAQIQQVVLNLFTNAIDALQNHPVDIKRIDIQAAITNAQVVLQVSDNGQGIDPEISSHIFDLLRTSKDHGMGVGLWLSRTIVESHQGTISFTSVKGEPTVFTITLPANNGELIS